MGPSFLRNKTQCLFAKEQVVSLKSPQIVYNQSQVRVKWSDLSSSFWDVHVMPLMSGFLLVLMEHNPEPENKAFVHVSDFTLTGMKSQV